ncbi:MAG: oligopeptidase A [Myxococcota bacterium]
MATAPQVSTLAWPKGLSQKKWVEWARRRLAGGLNGHAGKPGVFHAFGEPPSQVDPPTDRFIFFATDRTHPQRPPEAALGDPTTASSANPLLAYGTLPDFGAIKAEHVTPAVEATIAACETMLAAVEAAAAELHPEVLVARLEPIADQLGWMWTLANHLNSVRTSDAVRDTLEANQPAVVTFSSRMGQSKPIYAAFAAATNRADFVSLRPEIRRIIELEVRAAQHAGVGLEGAEREAFNGRKQQLAQLSMKFGNNVLDATKTFELVLTTAEEVAGLPESARALAAQSARSAGHEDATSDKGPWRITLAYPSYIPFMEHAERGDLREGLYRAFVQRASDGELDNGPLIEETLALRRQQAQALGFETYAELSVDGKMAPSVAQVQALLNELHEASHDHAERDLEALRAFAEEETGMSVELALWDHAYWTRRLKEARYSYSAEELRPYFPLPTVLDGLFRVAGTLFEMRFTQRTDISVWHPDVRYYDVLDDAGDVVAGFFLDPYSRPEDKRGGAWMNECVNRSTRLVAAGKDVRIPVAYLVCNQSPPIGDTPSLMTFREVETLFHEFGHGLQHMLTKVGDLAVAGISGIEWDAVELPSQFMENWVRHKPTLLGFAKHWQTGETLPEALADRVLSAQTFRAGSQSLRQLYFASLDLALHHDYVPGGAETVETIKRGIVDRFTVVKPLAEDRFLRAFTHLFAGGYAAGYYSYKWAEVLSADAFSAFEDVGLDNVEAVAQTGRRFRDTVLALGGSVDPMAVFVNFRGRPPSTKALLRHTGLAV